jgi:hypothetical protein
MTHCTPTPIYWRMFARCVKMSKAFQRKALRIQHRPEFKTFVELDSHMKREHNMFYCDLCVTHLRLFSWERKCYTRQELAQHRRQGDTDDQSYERACMCAYAQECARLQRIPSAASVTTASWTLIIFTGICEAIIITATYAMPMVLPMCSMSRHGHCRWHSINLVHHQIYTRTSLTRISFATTLNVPSFRGRCIVMKSSCVCTRRRDMVGDVASVPCSWKWHLAFRHS